MNVFELLGAGIGFSITALFAYHAYTRNYSVNPATWCSIFALDVIGVVLVILTSGRESSFPILQTVWSVSALMVAVVAVRNNNFFIWSQTETISLLIALCSTVAYVISKLINLSALWWVISYCVACLFSTAPQIKDYLRDATIARQGIPLQLWSGVSLVVSLIGVVYNDVSGPVSHTLDVSSLLSQPLIGIYLFFLLVNTLVLIAITERVRRG